MPVELTVIALAHAEIADPSLEAVVKALVTEPHLLVERDPPRHGSAASERAFLPIVHVVLLKRAGWTEAADARQPDRLLDVRRRRLVDIDPRPYLGLVGAARMPDSEGAGGCPKHGEIGKHRPDDRVDQPRTGAETCLDFGPYLLLVIEDLRHRRIANVVRADADQDVPAAWRHHRARRVGFGRDAAAEIGLDRGQMRPTDVIGVAAEIFGRKLPIARHDPFVDAADHLDPPLASVEEIIEVPGHFAEIMDERRRRGIEGGEIQPLVAVELRGRYHTPVLAVQLAVIGFLEIGYADERPVIAIGPAVIGAGKGGGVAVIGAAQAITTMPADVEEGVDLTRGVAHHQNRVFAHIGGEEIAGQRDLALVAQEQPAARENPLQFLLVDLWLDENPAAEQTVLGIDQAALHHGVHRLPLIHWSERDAVPAASPRRRPLQLSR